MVRTMVVCLSLGLTGTIAARASGGGSGGQDRQVALRDDLDGMTARLNGARQAPRQVIADAELMAAGYRMLGPSARGFGPSDYIANREITRRSLGWLARAGVLYGNDPLVAQAFLSSYDSIGGFYRDYGPFYQPGAFVAYASAMRLAQHLALRGGDPSRFERELDRFALAYGTIATGRGALLAPWTVLRDLPEVTAPKPGLTIILEPVELPEVDVAALNAGQRAAWTEVRDRFRSVAPRVHAARVLLNQLAERIQGRNITLHPEDAANALKMQGFLEDAVDLIREGRFDTALEALTRADYVREKLRSVTGQ